MVHTARKVVTLKRTAHTLQCVCVVHTETCACMCGVYGGGCMFVGVYECMGGCILLYVCGVVWVWGCMGVGVYG